MAHAVRRYRRFAPGFRDGEARRAACGVRGSDATVRRWVPKFGTYYAGALRRRRVRPGRTWPLAAMAARIAGRVPWVWRAGDEHGQTPDVLRPEHRATAAADRFVRRVLDVASGTPPGRVTTDTVGSHAAALARRPELAETEHPPARAAQRCDSRVAQAHRPTRGRERVRRRVESAASAPRFLAAFGRVGNLFRPRRHRPSAGAYRAARRERVTTGRGVTGLRAA